MKDKLNLTILLDISILVPHGVAVRARPAEIALASPEWPQTKRLPIDHFLGREGSIHPPTATLQGTDRELPAVFSLWYSPIVETELPQTGIPQVKEFTLEFPVFEINGVDFQPEPIDFRSYRKLTLTRCLRW